MSGCPGCLENVLFVYSIKIKYHFSFSLLCKFVMLNSLQANSWMIFAWLTLIWLKKCADIDSDLKFHLAIDSGFGFVSADMDFAALADMHLAEQKRQEQNKKDIRKKARKAKRKLDPEVSLSLFLSLSSLS